MSTVGTITSARPALISPGIHRLLQFRPTSSIVGRPSRAPAIHWLDDAGNEKRLTFAGLAERCGGWLSARRGRRGPWYTVVIMLGRNLNGGKS